MRRAGSAQRGAANAARERGFAFPLVMLLALVSGLVAAVLLERHSITSLAMARQINGYRQYHQSAGLRELVNRWMQSSRGRLQDSIMADGLAFRLRMPRSGTIEVYFFDAQGMALSDYSGLGGRRREIVQDTAALLTNPPPDLAGVVAADPGPLTRAHGPASISIRSAPPAVLEALCLAVTANTKTARQAAAAIEDYAAELLRAEENERGGAAGAGGTGGAGGVGGATGALASGGVGRVLMDEGLEADDIREIESMLVTRNTLWQVVAEVRDDAGRLIDRSGGLFEASERIDTFNQNAGFLSWDSLPLE